MGHIAVVHLARQVNGIEPFKSFIRSYRQHSAGIDHDLIVAYKGFRRESDADLWQLELGTLPHHAVFVDDQGFDVNAYWKVAERLPHQNFCFLNSFSIILDVMWLSKLYKYGMRPEIGLVGTTSSYESPVNGFLCTRNNQTLSVRQRILYPFRWAIHALNLWRYYPMFPNPHIRSNGIFLRRDVLSRVRVASCTTKRDAVRFECGRRSLTRQVQDMKLETIVVGRDGRGYRPEDWPRSFTFRQRKQQNLILADNRTQQYYNSSIPERKLLSLLAWGRDSDTE